MLTLRQTVVATTDLACRVAGRQQVVRSARFVLRRACLDVPNNMRTNGELWLQRRVIELSPPGEAIPVVDAGANIGRWSTAMLQAARQGGRLSDLELHAIEPCSYTFERLSETLTGQPVSLARLALSDRGGTSTLHVLAPGAGTNSLHKPAGAPAGATREEVPTRTLDDYAGNSGLERIAFVKIDAEGHDLAVLRGARRLLDTQRITVMQFEYNHRWVYGRFFLRDAFELLQPAGYRIGKLTPKGIEFYPAWDADLETFVEGNYVACTDWAAKRLPSVKWWKLEGGGA
jgi:FkbM family methyltransferase